MEILVPKTSLIYQPSISRVYHSHFLSNVIINPLYCHVQRMQTCNTLLHEVRITLSKQIHMDVQKCVCVKKWGDQSLNERCLIFLWKSLPESLMLELSHGVLHTLHPSWDVIHSTSRRCWQLVSKTRNNSLICDVAILCSNTDRRRHSQVNSFYWHEAFIIADLTQVNSIKCFLCIQTNIYGQW